MGLDLRGECAKGTACVTGHSVGEPAGTAPGQGPQSVPETGECRRIVVAGRWSLVASARTSSATAGTPNMHGPHCPADSPAARLRTALTWARGQCSPPSTWTTPSPSDSWYAAGPARDHVATSAAAGVRRRTSRAGWGDLPSGAVVVEEDATLLVIDDAVVPWTRRGYETRRRRPASGSVDLLTPGSSVLALLGGYRPQLDAGVADC